MTLLIELQDGTRYESGITGYDVTVSPDEPSHITLLVGVWSQLYSGVIGEMIKVMRSEGDVLIEGLCVEVRQV